MDGYGEINAPASMCSAPENRDRFPYASVEQRCLAFDRFKHFDRSSTHPPPSSNRGLRFSSDQYWSVGIATLNPWMRLANQRQTWMSRAVPSPLVPGGPVWWHSEQPWQSADSQYGLPSASRHPSGHPPCTRFRAQSVTNILHRNILHRIIQPLSRTLPCGGVAGGAPS